MFRRLFALSVVGLAIGCARSHDQPRTPPLPPATPPIAVAPPKTVPPPSPADPAIRLAHGAELYGKICAVCHGAKGEGYRADRAPALGQQDFLASVSDEYLDYAIRVGRSGTTMSAWADDQGGPLDKADIAALIAFLRSWQLRPREKLDDGPVTGDVGRGRQIFKQQCEHCHGHKGQYEHLVDRQQLAKANSGFLRYAIRVGRPPTAMASFEKTLGDQGVEDVVAYLKGLPGWVAPGELPGAPKLHPLPLGKTPLNPKGPEPIGFSNYPKMTSIEAIAPQYARHARMAILDARAPSDYQRGHIAGAVSVPYYDPQIYLDQLPKHTWLVCYCGCPHAESGSLAAQLVEAGFDKVTVLDEGFGVWMQKNLPTHTGVDP